MDFSVAHRAGDASTTGRLRTYGTATRFWNEVKTSDATFEAQEGAGRAPAVDARMQARLRHQRRRGSAECSPAKSRAAPDGTGGKERESRGDEGSCLRGRLPGPRRRPDRLTGVGSRLRLFPGWLIGLQTRIPFVGGAGIAHCDGRCGTDAGRMGCIGIRSAAVGSGKLRDRRCNRVSFNDRVDISGSPPPGLAALGAAAARWWPIEGGSMGHRGYDAIGSRLNRPA
ncbi:g189 [Coccomyxa elongata]